MELFHVYLHILQLKGLDRFWKIEHELPYTSLLEEAFVLIQWLEFFTFIAKTVIIFIVAGYILYGCVEVIF